jgi:thiamine biosynthesis lipoprotein
MGVVRPTRTRDAEPMRLAVPPIDPAALAGWDPHAAIIELDGATMGTRWRARFAAPARLDLPGLTRAIEAMLGEIVAEMSHWAPDSLISRFNRAPAGRWLALPPDFATVMVAALDVAAASDGAFDPAVGALVDLWGYGPVSRPVPPDAAAIEAAVAQGGWRQLRFDPAARRLQRLGDVQLDLSGIAKGYAVDRLSAVLAAHDVRHNLVEIGGEFVGRGLRPDGDPWWVELETPGAMAAPFRVALHQLAVATSGDYVRGRHTVDPRTGQPVAHALAVSVVHASAMLADAWATALGVAEPDEMMALAEAHGLPARALIRRRDGVMEWISPALAAMIEG